MGLGIGRRYTRWKLKENEKTHYAVKSRRGVLLLWSISSIFSAFMFFLDSLFLNDFQY